MFFATPFTLVFFKGKISLGKSVFLKKPSLIAKTVSVPIGFKLANWLRVFRSPLATINRGVKFSVT